MNRHLTFSLNPTILRRLNDARTAQWHYANRAASTEERADLLEHALRIIAKEGDARSRTTARRALRRVATTFGSTPTKTVRDGRCVDPDHEHGPDGVCLGPKRPEARA